VTDEEIDNVLEVTGLRDRRDSRIKTFSTGMRQRVCLAKVLLIKPKLILLDEPFSGMDIEGRSQLVQLLKKILEEQNIGMLISSHLIHDIEQITTKVCILRDGKCLAERPVSEIKASCRTIEEYYLEVMSNNRAAEMALQ
jgi:ABC-2 type transport system ATP-binding protein